MTKPYKEKLNNVLQKRGRNVMASLTASSRCVGRTRTRGCTRQLIFKYVSYFNFSEKKKKKKKIAYRSIARWSWKFWHAIGVAASQVTCNARVKAAPRCRRRSDKQGLSVATFSQKQGSASRHWKGKEGFLCSACATPTATANRHRVAKSRNVAFRQWRRSFVVLGAYTLCVLWNKWVKCARQPR